MQIASIPLHIHWSFWLVLLYLGASGGWHSGDPFFSMSLFALLMCIVTLHELGHSFTARALGIRVDKISITGIGGIAELGDFLDSKKELLVTIAGPVVNIVIALLMWPFLAIGKASSPSLLDSLWVLNLIVLLFNLIPMYPMDGGRIFRIVMSRIVGELRSYAVSKYVNLGLLGLAIVLCLQYNQHIMLIILGFMGLYGVTTCRNMELIIDQQIKSEAELKALFSSTLKESKSSWQQGEGVLSNHKYQYQLTLNGDSGNIRLQDLTVNHKSLPVSCHFCLVDNALSWTPRYVIYLFYLQACLDILRAQFSTNQPANQKA